MSNHRKFLVAGNWKMNLDAAEGAELAREIHAEVGRQTDVSVAVCPPFTALEAVGRALGASNIALGAQNMHHASSGAFTGEVSAEMLRHLDCAHVILGHSERRQHLHESDAFINRKVLAALEANLMPILCVGETLEEREAGNMLDVVRAQIEGGLAGVDARRGDSVVIAYEPVWAIGTGKTATPDMAEEAHAEVRCMLAKCFDQATAETIRILYGGSMKPENADDLLAQPNIDGGLIGGASLKAPAFNGIVQSALRRCGA